MMQAACTRLIVWLGNERFHRMSFNLYAAEQHRAILALGPSFGKAELKTAYQGLIRQWHPDPKFGAKPEIQAEATEKTKVINVAYEFLSEVLDLRGGIYRAPRNRIQPQDSKSLHKVQRQLGLQIFRRARVS